MNLNDEARMTNDETMTNDKARKFVTVAKEGFSSFELGHSFVIRHLDFVIATSSCPS